MKKQHRHAAGGSGHRHKGAQKHRQKPGKGHNHHQRRGPAAQTPRGAKTCPMCGAVVNDLGAHIRDKHDDIESHPI